MTIPMIDLDAIDYREILKQYEQPTYFKNVSDPGVNEARAVWFDRYMKLPQGSFILELGAGRFTLTREWRKLGYEAWGIDWSIFGCAHDPDMAVRGMVQRLPFKDKSFDAVTAFDILEHIPPEDIALALADIERVTKIWLICNIPLEGPDPADHHHLSKGDRAFWEEALKVSFDLVDYNPPNTPGFNSNSTIFVARARN